MGMIDGRFARIDIKITDLGNQDAIVQKMAADIPVNMMNAFLLPGGKPAHIQTKSGSIIVWTELDRLQLGSVYTVGRDAKRWPLFKERAEAPPELEASFLWDPSMVSMRLYFTSTLNFDMRAKSYTWKQSCLVAKAPKRKEIFRPPLSNIFSDSRVCMGNDYSHTGPCLADVYCHNLAHLNSSRWNAHETHGMTGDQIKALYSFDEAGKQLPPPEGFKWWEMGSCNPVSTFHFSDLPLV